MDEVQHRVVNPENIALLIGVPLTRDALDADLERRRTDPTDGRGDFAWSETGGGEISAATARMLDELQTLMDTARRIGVPDRQIYPAATLDAVSEASESGRGVIILLAHWKGVMVSSQDFASGALDYILGAARLCSNNFGSALDKFCRERREPTKNSELAQVLNDFIKSFDITAGNRAEATHRMVRDAMDAQFSSVLAPGNGIELRDGIHKPALINAALSPDWSGIGDLAVCHSMTLAEYLRDGRQDRRFIANTKPKFLARVLAELREALVRIGDHPQPWVPLRAQISADYSKLIGELADARR